MATVAIVAVLALASCSSGSSSTGAGMADAMNGYQAHPMSMPMAGTQLPSFAMGNHRMAEAYTFALEHPEVVTYMPCTCGCEAMGHESNWNCYIKGIDESGVVSWEPHASGCGVCQDITRDAARLWAQGMPLPQVRQWIDQTYAGGSPTMQTELPPST
jgi:hypothetical protein